jgi:hypothetical protein
MRFSPLLLTVAHTGWVVPCWRHRLCTFTTCDISARQRIALPAAVPRHTTHAVHNNDYVYGGFC